MKIKPLCDRVLIKLGSAEEKTKSGLYIPQTAQEKTHQGFVIDKGLATTIEDGDRVLYDKYAGTAVKIDGADHLLLEIKDILAIVKE